MSMSDNPKFYNDNNEITRIATRLTLEEFTPKFTWHKRNNLRVIDLGCGDGSVTEILSKYLPKDYELLLGSDISEKMIKYASDRYSNERTKFVQLDITADLPDNFKENFGFVFSSHLFHWVREQEKGFMNVYNLLIEGGECLITLFGYTPIYHVLIGLSMTEKWKPYMQNLHEILSPYYDKQSPDLILTELLKKIGFKHVDVKSRQSTFTFKNKEDIESVSKIAITSDTFPTTQLYEEFHKDYARMAQQMQLVDPINNSYKFIYNLIIIHCIK